MESTRRKLSTSPPNPRPSKTGKNSSNCDASGAKRSRRQLTGGSDQKHRATYSASPRSPSKRSSTNLSVYSEREGLQFNNEPNISFSPFSQTSGSTFGSRSLNSISSQPSIDGIQPSHETSTTRPQGMERSRNSPRQLQGVAQFDTRGRPSNIESDAASDPRSQGKNAYHFGSAAAKKLFSGSDITSGIEPPTIVGFDDDLNDDFNFHALSSALDQSDFLASMNDLPKSTCEQDSNILAQNLEPFCSETMGIFSPIPTDSSSLRGSHEASWGVESCSENSRTCMITAIKILQALHIPPTTCMSTSGGTSISGLRQPRLMDSVLSTNRGVIQLVSEILKCTCSLSSQTQLLLTIICGKLMSWYRAMLRNDGEGCNNSTVIPTANSNANYGQHTERIVHQTITVGEYSFDVALERKLWAQVVFNELHFLESLIENLSMRVQEDKFQKSSSAAIGRGRSTSSADSWRSTSPQETRLPETVQSSLNVFLQSQLGVVKAETNSRLSGESSHPRASR